MKQQKVWPWLVAVGTVVLVLSGCGSSESDDETTSVEAPTSTAATTSDDGVTQQDNGPDEGDTAEEEIDAGSVARDPAAPFSVDAEYEADAQPVLEWGTPFEPGAYRTGAVGTPMSFTTTERLSTQTNGYGAFVVTDVSSRAPDDRDIVFMRAGGFSDPTAPDTPIDQQTPWPSDDFLGWLENHDDGVIATDPVETSVNGLPATRVDLELSDDVDCGYVPGFCVGLLTNHGQDFKALNRNASYRVWVVEQGDGDPLVITAGIARDEDAAWFERADAVLDTVAFGDIAPNPVQWLTPGTAQLNALGGMQAIVPDNVAELTNGRQRLVNMWTGRGLALIPINDQPGAIYFSERPHDLDGNPLSSADEVVDELAAAGVEVTELDATKIGGADTRVFDVTHAQPWEILLKFSTLDAEAEFLGWDAPAAGRIWLIDHADRGLMMVSTHAFEAVDEVLPVVNELAEAVLGSMTFTD